MPTPLEDLRWERRRKLQVRETFSRGLEYFRAADGDATEFYLACGDYLVAGQRRLIDQDRRLVEMLASRVPVSQQEDHRAMQALRERLSLAQTSLAEFENAVGRLRARRVAGRADFEAASARFLDVLINVLGARSHSLRHLTTTLLADDDWRQVVAITPAFIAEEARSFARVSELAPPGMRPENMSSGEQPGVTATARGRPA